MKKMRKNKNHMKRGKNKRSIYFIKNFSFKNFSFLSSTLSSPRYVSQLVHSTIRLMIRCKSSICSLRSFPAAECQNVLVLRSIDLMAHHTTHTCILQPFIDLFCRIFVWLKDCRDYSLNDGNGYGVNVNKNRSRATDTFGESEPPWRLCYDAIHDPNEPSYRQLGIALQKKGLPCQIT